MSTILEADCLDRWLGSFPEFRYDFLRFTQSLGKAVGLNVACDQAALQIAHDNWKAKHSLWQLRYVSPDTKELSHIKIMALCLHELACVTWLKEPTEYVPTGARSDPQFAGTDLEKEAVREDIIEGGGTYLAFQFTVQVVNWFEQGRIDRRDKFYFRLTADLEHDIMVFLMSERRDELATYLIFKAIYTRDPLNGHPDGN